MNSLKKMTSIFF